MPSPHHRSSLTPGSEPSHNNSRHSIFNLQQIFTNSTVGKATHICTILHPPIHLQLSAAPNCWRDRLSFAVWPHRHPLRKAPDLAQLVISVQIKAIQVVVGRVVILECLYLFYCLLTPLKEPGTLTSGGVSDVPVMPHGQEAPVNTGGLQDQAPSQDATNLGGPQAISHTVSLSEQAVSQSQITNIQQNSIVPTGPVSTSGYRTRSSTQSLPAANTRYIPPAAAPKRAKKHPSQAAPQAPPPNPAATSGQAHPTLPATNTTASSQANYQQDVQGSQLQPLPTAGSISTAIQAPVPPSSSAWSITSTVAPYPQAAPLPALRPSVQSSAPAASMLVQDPVRSQPMQFALLNDFLAIYYARFPTFSTFPSGQYPVPRVVIGPLATLYPYTSSPGPDNMGTQPQYPPYGNPPFPLNNYLGRDLNYGPCFPSMAVTGGPSMVCFQRGAADARVDVGFGPGVEIADEFKALAERYAREHRREIVKGDKAVLGMGRME
ncbi:hypothetical protein GJ744_003006 [Endocarpon pusillum]|uniref:Uncharacterized protein n=1 Tax=Endocarpon pusillum TaxID=364733 RepID=A0A8H7A781_9EURO|nr:hypothetical protein GJ744_003006 [Endocarpon pusillum]